MFILNKAVYPIIKKCVHTNAIRLFCFFFFLNLFSLNCVTLMFSGTVQVVICTLKGEHVLL